MTYLQLAVIALTVAVAVHLAAVAVARRRGTLPAGFARATAVTLLVLLGLTVVFDSIMVAADLFRYDEAALAGPRLWLAPIEDLAWPVAAGLVLPALWAAGAPRE